jgi:hypothetical protein
VQRRALHLKPWQSPPCAVDENDTDERRADAVQLLQRMLANGISAFDPDPLAALRKCRPKRSK